MATIITILIFITLFICAVDADEDRKVHIVYMGHQSSQDYLTESHYLRMLDQVLQGCASKDSLVYSYNSFRGLAAKLTTTEKEKLAGMKGVVSVFESKILHTQTTRSWDFLHFPVNASRNPTVESNVIVGMIDTGIWPESESFSDKGFGPPPAKWKGSCVNLTCNNKIIGARFYNSFNDTSQEPSPRDFEGHGSHTSSTVAGDGVLASLYGLARGTARGAVPSARLAMYKVCWSFGCAEHDILAAFDDAIADGVDIISISIGGPATDYFMDSIAIGAFHAMKNGILTSASGGNSGPFRGSMDNVAPWMLVVAASSIDRHIIDKLVLGDHSTIVGASINTFPSDNRLSPFTYFGDGMDCDQLEKNQTEGKIVLCGYATDGSGPLLAGAKGAVMLYDYTDYAFSFPLPTLFVSSYLLEQLKLYIDNASNPSANVPKSQQVFDATAPVIASFSSRGPNVITPNILKPDISAPGINILAAWSPVAPMSVYANDTRSVKYNIISGTSMACPHVSGSAAYVKSFHPQWSPAAIMSALMTTASPMNPCIHEDEELSYGSGQVNPVGALTPGLVYDASEADYVEMLCNQGYNASLVRLVTGDSSSCSSSSNATAPDLNYPSMTYYAKLSQEFATTFSRTVTNVGLPSSKYTATIKAGVGLRVSVEPCVLSFTELGEKKNFVVTVSGGPPTVNSLATASLIWSDGKHSVRSVIVVYTDYS